MPDLRCLKCQKIMKEVSWCPSCGLEVCPACMPPDAPCTSPFLQVAADALAIAVLEAIESGYLGTRTGPSDALEQYAMVRFDTTRGNEIYLLRELRDYKQQDK